MSAARIDSDGNVAQLDGKAGARAVLTADDAKDPEKMARLVAGLLDDVAELRRRHAPNRLDFEDVTVDAAGTTFSLQHNLAGRVRWYVVAWSSAGATGHDIKESLAPNPVSDDDTLRLQSYTAGTATIRVEAAG